MGQFRSVATGRTDHGKGTARTSANTSGGKTMTDGSAGRRIRNVVVVATAVLAMTAMVVPVGGLTEGGPAQAEQNGSSPAAATTITACGDISSSGLYELGNDLSASSGDCIDSSASDVILDGMGYTVDGASSSYSIDVQGSSTLSNVTVRNVSVTGAARGISVDDATDVHIEAVDAYQNDRGIQFSDVGQSFINDTTASNASSDAGILLFSGANNVTVDNATVTDNPGDGFDVAGSDISINGSLIEDNGDPSDTRVGAGIEAGRADNLTVTNNRIKNNSHAIQEGSFDATDILVQNNRIAVQRDGVDFFEGSNWTIAGNNFTRASTTDAPYGMYIGAPDVTVTDNEFYNLDTGVYTYSDSGDPTNEFSVVNNYFENLDRGLVLSKGVSSVASNEFSGVGTGIDVSEGSQSVLEDNTFVGGSGAIEVNGNSKILNRTELVGNTIESTSGDAITVVNAGKTEIRQNTIEGAGDDGIVISGGADNFVVDNTVAGSQFWDFKTINDATNTTVENLDVGASTAPGTTVDFDARNVRLAGTSSVPDNPDGQADLGRYVEAESAGANSYLNVTFQYEDGDLTGVDESNVSVWNYDSSWSELGGTLDTGANEISVNVTSFSTFAPLANATLLTEEWSASTAGRSQYSTPEVGPDHVFVGGLDDTLYAFNRPDGSLDWQFDRGGSLADSSPTLSAGTVYVGSGGGVLYALDATDGSTKWTYTTDSAIVSSPVVAGGTVYVGSNDGTVLALDADTGSEDWSEETGAAVLSTPAVDSGSVYVTTDDGRLLSLDASTGSQQWSFATNTEVGHSSPAVGSDVVYVAADQTYAVYAANGSEKWSTDIGGTVGSTPTVESGFVYVGSADGSVYRLSATDGATTWQVPTGAPVGSSPALVSGRVIIGSDNGTVHVIDADVGNEVGYVDLGSVVRSSPAIGDDVAFLGSRSGTVYALANLQTTPTSSSSIADGGDDDSSGSDGQQQAGRGSGSSGGTDDDCSDSGSRSRGSDSGSSCESDRSR